MNDFTKEELEELQYLIDERESSYGLYGRHDLGNKVRVMIYNYCEDETKWVAKIAKAHLEEASSLIHHACCLLKLNDTDK